jgi:hypothetical protein
MQPVLLGVSFALLSIIGSPTPYALAEDTKVARGTVVALGGDSLTVNVRDQEMTFSIDSKTIAEARGAGSKTRAARASGKTGLRLADVMKVGQAVAVTYHEMNGVRHASVVRALGAASAGTGSAAREPASLRSNGTVQSIAPNAITITGNAGAGASFTQTFMIDERTRVFAKGAGTAAAKRGGRAPFNELVTSGDHVRVSYHQVAGTLRASDVRVMVKGTH